MDIRLLVKKIVTILRQNGYMSEATSLENSEYGATSGEIFGNIICNLIELKKNNIIYNLIQDKAEMILDYVKLIGLLKEK
jgi:hypothetical protein